MNTDFPHDNYPSNPLVKTAAARMAATDRESQTALPTLLLLVPCLLAGIWLLVST